MGKILMKHVCKEIECNENTMYYQVLPKYALNFLITLNQLLLAIRHSFKFILLNLSTHEFNFYFPP